MNLGRTLGAALAALILLAGGRPAAAQDNPAIVRPDPLTLEVGLGQEEDLTLIMENASDVYGIDVRLRFDPSLVEVVDVDPAKEGVQMLPGSFIKPDFLVRNLADNQAGTLQYVTTQVNPTPPAAGQGVVLTIKLRGKALGESPLAVEFVNTASNRGVKLPVQGQDGVIRIVPAKDPTRTPTVAATAAPEATRAPKAAQTEPASPALATQPPAATDPAAAPAIRAGAGWLVWVAGGGFCGAIVLLGLAAFVGLRHKPQKKTSEEA